MIVFAGLGFTLGVDLDGLKIRVSVVRFGHLIYKNFLIQCRFPVFGGVSYFSGVTFRTLRSYVPRVIAMLV